MPAIGGKVLSPSLGGSGGPSHSHLCLFYSEYEGYTFIRSVGEYFALGMVHHPTII
jgi:hypothetical protein